MNLEQKRKAMLCIIEIIAVEVDVEDSLQELKERDH